MIEYMNEVLANSVPAAAVIQSELALFINTGCKTCVDIILIFW